MLPLQRILVFDFGLFKVHSWGLLIVIAICAALYISYRESRRLKLDPILWRNSVMLLFIFGLLGMRTFRFIRLFDYANMQDAVYAFFVRPAVDSFGGVLGIIAVIIYLRSKRADIGRYADSFALAGATLIIISRFGCLLVLDELGSVTSVPWGVFYDGALRHPVALYYMINGMFAFILLSLLIKKKAYPYPGFLINVFFIAFPVGRGLIDFFRADPTAIFLGLDILQISYFILMTIAICVMIRNRKHLRTLSSSGNPR